MWPAVPVMIVGDRWGRGTGRSGNARGVLCLPCPIQPPAPPVPGAQGRGAFWGAHRYPLCKPRPGRTVSALGLSAVHSRAMARVGTPNSGWRGARWGFPAGGVASRIFRGTPSQGLGRRVGWRVTFHSSALVNPTFPFLSLLPTLSFPPL